MNPITNIRVYSKNKHQCFLIVKNWPASTLIILLLYIFTICPYKGRQLKPIKNDETCMTVNLLPLDLNFMQLKK